jgi:hypothetical protein
MVMSKWTEVPGGQVNAATQRLLVAMGDEANTIISGINADKKLASRLMKFALNSGYASSTSYMRAREIMGNNFLGIEIQGAFFGVNHTSQQVIFLSEVPFSEKVLIACKDTHLLVAEPALSILRIRHNGPVISKLPAGQKKFFFYQTCYDREPFANSRCELGWGLIPKVDPESFDQKETVIKPQVVVCAIICYFLITSERLFEASSIRCTGTDSKGKPIYIGFFDTEGLYIGNSYKDRRRAGLWS